MTRPIHALAVAVLLSPAATPALAGAADVIAAEARQGADGRWTVSATIRHGDTGWDHYADAFEVLGPDGTSYGVRTLFHPHVEEQPFTRSLAGVAIPDAVTTIRVRAHDSVHGFGGAEAVIELAR